jgi:hypothetical protein
LLECFLEGAQLGRGVRYWVLGAHERLCYQR